MATASFSNKKSPICAPHTHSPQCGFESTHCDYVGVLPPQQLTHLHPHAAPNAVLRAHTAMTFVCFQRSETRPPAPPHSPQCCSDNAHYICFCLLSATKLNHLYHRTTHNMVLRAHTATTLVCFQCSFHHQKLANLHPTQPTMWFR